MFKLGINGFSMTFENEYSVSVRWHKCTNYVTGRVMRFSTLSEIESMAEDSIDAEVAVLDPESNFIMTPFNEYDTVIGFTSPKDVLKIMEWAAAL